MTKQYKDNSIDIRAASSILSKMMEKLNNF